MLRVLGRSAQLLRRASVSSRVFRAAASRNSEAVGVILVRALHSSSVLDTVGG